MNLRANLFWAVTCLTVVSSTFAQKVELTGLVGWQLNGSADLSTSLLHKLDVQNSRNYLVSVGYWFDAHYAIELQWNHMRADTAAQPRTGGSDIKLFILNQNQYTGNILYQYKSEESRLRPFFFVGFGASTLSTNRASVNGATRFAYALGGGAKYNLTKHLGLRGQVKYSPTYLSTSGGGGYWCSPIWGGCWAGGDSQNLHEFDVTGGITFRFK